jgi:DNA-binding response OmpR family regulator
MRYTEANPGKEAAMYNILICDDEADIVNALKIYLSDPSYLLLTASNGKEALEVMAREDVHLCLLDIMMPEMDGILTLSKIRETSNVPVIFLTAKGEDTDKILGLNIGADDYITKPFSPLEVTARVRSQLRRYMQLGGREQKPETAVVGGIELDDRTKAVTLDGEPVSLTPIEFDILKLLITHPGQVFSPKEIYGQVWHDIPLGSDNTVAVHIRHLREKLEINPAEPRFLKVVWGQGYKLEDKP